MLKSLTSKSTEALPTENWPIEKACANTQAEENEISKKTKNLRTI